MNPAKKIALVTGVSIGLLSVTACNQNESASSNPGEAIPSDDPISIMTILHTAEVPDQRIEEMIEEKTDTKLDIQWIPNDSYTERLNAAFATGTLPQVGTDSIYRSF